MPTLEEQTVSVPQGTPAPDADGSILATLLFWWEKFHAQLYFARIACFFFALKNSAQSKYPILTKPHCLTNNLTARMVIGILVISFAVWIGWNMITSSFSVGLYSPRVIKKQIDALIDESSKDSPALAISLSPTEKQAVIDYMVLLQKTTKKKYNQPTLSHLLILLNGVKYSKKIDVYVVNQTHIAINTDILLRSARKRDNAIDKEEKEIQGQVVRDILAQGDVLTSMLPKSNRLSGNAHDVEEKERLDKIKRENKTKSLF